MSDFLNKTLDMYRAVSSKEEGNAMADRTTVFRFRETMVGGSSSGVQGHAAVNECFRYPYVDMTTKTFSICWDLLVACIDCI